MASQIGAGLVGVMYILDEPSIGLHQRDNDRLLSTLFHLRDLGNTVIVVEHDEEAIRSADYIIDIDPALASMVVGSLLRETLRISKKVKNRLQGSFYAVMKNTDTK